MPRFALDLGKNTMGNAKGWPLWRKPYILRFLNSKNRKAASTYPNYFRLIWWKVDFSLEWGLDLKAVHPPLSKPVSRGAKRC